MAEEKPSLRERAKKAWSIFRGKTEPQTILASSGPSSSIRLDRVSNHSYGKMTIVDAVFNRIAVDASQVKIAHVQCDDNGRYTDTINDDLNKVFNVRANLDQSFSAFKVDIYQSLCKCGVIALVPTYIDEDKAVSILKEWNGDTIPDISEMRVGEVTQWYARAVRVKVYDDISGIQREATLPKKNVGIVENPFWTIMNPHNSIASVIQRKLKLLDYVDSQIGSDKLNLIIQVPYSLKSPLMQEQVKRRQGELNSQLAESKYGIGYIDSSEKVIQLNRPLENDLLSQLEFFTKMFYTQLGITEEIINGSADEKTMLNYNSRIIEPLISAVVNEIRSKFLSSEQLDDHEDYMYFSDMFKLVPAGQMAEIADKYTRNEIATKNEIRSLMGWKPSTDPKADMLINSNINHPDEESLSGGNSESKDDVNPPTL